MALEEYRQKRHFKKTPEPAGKAIKKQQGGRLKFVVQKHAASHLHYDFRLELDGVLKSWAVPKGPSLDPSVKRLAVEVEDHPLDYGSFEGTIPAGEYGAGEVIVWDRGTWTPDANPAKALQRGKLEFQLAGEKLSGGWRLLLTKNRPSSKPNWLLMKRNDDAARASAEYDILTDRPESVKSGRELGEPEPKSKKLATAKAPARKKSPRRRGKSKFAPADIAGSQLGNLPGQFKPQLASLGSETPTGDEYLHEIKFDGYRIVCRVQDGEAQLLTRNQLDWTHRYPAIAAAIAELPVVNALFDGEVVALLPSGISSFQELQNAGKAGDATQLVYYIFDLLHLDGYDLRGVTLADRKQLLAEVLQPASGSRLQFSEHFAGDGPEFFRQSCRLGLEGVISKRRDRAYNPGRSSDWLKTKCLAREELVIGGYTLSAAAQRGIGALLVGYFEDEQLIYSGRVGTGFDAKTLLDLRKCLEAIHTPDCPFAKVPSKERGPSLRWVRPQLVAQLEFTGWTGDSVLRHPSFQGLREDQPATSVGRPQSLTLAEKSSEPRPRKTSMKKKSKSSSLPPPPTLPETTSVTLTHPERVLYPDAGLTKFGLATYYAQVSHWILPHLKDRPLSLVRCPDGQAEKCFYQKHAVASTPKALRRVDIDEGDSVVQYVAVDDLDGLLSLVQMSVLEIHPWGSRSDRLEQPDRMIFDLDPDDAVAWPRVIEAAHAVRELLEAHKLTSFLKTTGGKGLHIVVPLAPRRQKWPAVKAFCQSVANELSAAAPKLYVAKMSKAARQGKIFIDYLRNDRGATAVAPFSTRARPGAPVSVPLAWDELTSALRSDHFHVGNVVERLKSLRNDPWAGFFEVRQTLPKR